MSWQQTAHARLSATEHKGANRFEEMKQPHGVHSKGSLAAVVNIRCVIVILNHTSSLLHLKMLMSF